MAMSDRAIREGLKACSWPGRLQIVGKAPHIVLDCAHAPAAAQALADSLRTYFRYERLFTVVGMNEDKDVAGFAQALAPLRPRLYLCRADLPRSLPVSDLKARSLGLWQDAAGYDDVASALWAALADAGPADLVCVTGSVYVVGEAMSALGLDVV
ncbi:MAG: hypothetical protein H5T86_05590 [Armatimonadetes bacterium]|nr:hypothetical protein [Armatimonadota bacterium]